MISILHRFDCHFFGILKFKIILYGKNIEFGWHNDKPIEKDSKITIIRFGAGKELFFRNTGDSSVVTSYIIENGDLWTATYELNGKQLYLLKILIDKDKTEHRLAKKHYAHNLANFPQDVSIAIVLRKVFLIHNNLYLIIVDITKPS